MQFSYNLDEVLQIATRIEQNGRAFYETAAAVLPAHEEWLLFLAAQEKAHEAFYETLRGKYAEKDSVTDSMMGDQTEILEGYLYAMADSVVFRLAEDPKKHFSGNETIEQIIDDAISREKDSVLFFTGIKDAVDDEKTKSDIDIIIKEEMSHLSMLQRKKLEFARSFMEEAGKKVFDLIVVGAGPGGIAAAAEAIAKGTDRRNILVLEAASRNGWSMRKLFPEQRLVTANYKGYGGECRGVMKFRNMLKESAVKMLSETVGDFGIHVLYDFPVKKVHRDNGLFTVETKDESFCAQNCIIAVGVYGEPRIPDYEIPIALKPRTFFDLGAGRVQGKEVLVVGGSDTAAVYTEHLIRSDNRVTVSCREKGLSAMNEHERQRMRSLIDAEEAFLLEGTDIERLEAEGDGVEVFFKQEIEPRVYDRIVYALGGTSPLASIELPDVVFEGDYPALSEHYETNLEGLYLVGDIAAPGRHGAIIFALNTAEHVVRRLAESGRLQPQPGK